MRFILKTIIYSLVLWCVIFVGLFMLPQQYYKDGIVWLIEEKTGSKLTLAGDIEFTPLSEKMVTFNGAKLTQTPDPNSTIVIDFGSLALVRSGLNPSQLRVRDTNFNLKDKIADTDFTLSQINADVDLPILGSAIKVDGDAVYKRQKVNFKGEIEDPEALGKGGKSDVSFKADNDFFGMAYEGEHSKLAKEGRLKASLISVEKISRWLTGEAKVGANGNMEFTYSIKGDDISTLNGTAGVYLKDITNKFVDPGLKQMMKKITGKDDSVKELKASFDIENGVIHSEDLVGEAITKFTGRGVLNLVDQTINYRIKPDVDISKVKSIQEVIPPIAIKGSIFAPQITIDEKAIIEQIAKNPEAIVKTIKDFTNNTGDAKQIKKELQDFRDDVLRDPESSKKLLDNFLGQGAGDKIVPNLPAEFLKAPQQEEQPAAEQPAEAEPQPQPQQ